MKNTKTTIRELSARYRDILKKCFYLNAVALGLFAATSASATVNVDVNMSGPEVYTVNEVNSLLGAKANANNVYTKAETITAISDNINNTVYSDGKYSATAAYRKDNESTLSVTAGAPADTQYQFTLGENTHDYKAAGVGGSLSGDTYVAGAMNANLISVDGFTALDEKATANLSARTNAGTFADAIARNDSDMYTQGTSGYQFKMGATSATDPTVAAALSSTQGVAYFKYTDNHTGTAATVTLNELYTASKLTDGENGLLVLDDTTHLDKADYTFALSTIDPTKGGRDASITGKVSDGVDVTAYYYLDDDSNPVYFTADTKVEDLVGNDAAFEMFQKFAADSVAYKGTDGNGGALGVYNTDDTNYRKAIENYNTERTAFNDLVSAYDGENGYGAGLTAATTAYNTANADYQAADEAFLRDTKAYNDESEEYAKYNNSVQQAVDKRADKAIDRALDEGGAIRTAVTAGITNLITTKEGLLSQDIGYNLADPDNETTGLVARLEALTDESTDKTLVGAINANTGAIATLDSTKVNNAGNFTADTDSALIKGKTVVAAIQDTAAQVDTNTTAIGTLTSLTTDEKSNLVGAVNELNSTKVNNAGNFTAETDSALIKNKTVVAAIQSTASKVDAIDAAVGDISQLDTTKNMQGLTTVDTVHALNKLDDVIYTKVGDGAVTASSYTSGTKTLTQHVSAIGSALDASVGTTTAIAGIHGSYTAQATAPSSGSGSATAAPTLAAEVQAINDALENTLGTTAQLSALWGGGAGGADAPTNLAGYLNQQAGNAAATQAANEAQFAQLDSKIQKLETKMEKGLAANNALAGLVPLDHVHRTQVSAALGGYKDNQALAVGAFHYLNDRTLLNAGAAYGGNDSISYKVGVTFGF